jgi:hypothetical protein
MKTRRRKRTILAISYNSITMPKVKVPAPDRSQHVLSHVPQPVSLSVLPQRIRLGTANVKLVVTLVWISAQASQDRSSRRAAFRPGSRPNSCGRGPGGIPVATLPALRARARTGWSAFATGSPRRGQRACRARSRQGQMRDRFRREWLQHLCNEQRSGAGDLYRELFRLDLGWLHPNRELHYDDPSRVLRRADLRHRAR